MSASQGWLLHRGRLWSTSNGGASWQRSWPIPTPVAHVRFASLAIGYAWDNGGRLWATADGGRSWLPGGLDAVWDLETAAGTTWALAGPAPYPAVFRSPTGTSRWAQVGRTPNRGGMLILHGPVAYVLGEQGAGPIPPALDVYPPSGPVRHARLPCAAAYRIIPMSPVAAAPDGQLFVVCAVEYGDGRNGQLAYLSGDQGRSWTRTAPLPNPAAGVAATDTAYFAWNKDLWIDRAGHWTRLLHGRRRAPASPSSGSKPPPTASP